MIGRSLERAGVLLFSGTLVTGCGGEPTPLQNEPGVQEAFVAAKTYWVSQAKLAEVAGLKLITSDPNNPQSCTSSDGTFEVEASNATYCRGEKTIFLNREGFKDAVEYPVEVIAGRTPQAEKDVKYIIMAHELGHAVQDVSPESYQAVSAKTIISHEQAADCLAGVALKHIRPGVINTARIVYKEALPSFDFTHGTAKDRYNAFADGFKSGKSSTCANNYTATTEVLPR